MSHEIKIPELGESIVEGTIVSWLRAEGDLVAQNDSVLELETDKVTMEIAAPAAGRLTILVGEESVVKVGQVVGSIEEGSAVAAEPDPGRPTSPFTAEREIAPASGIAQARAKLTGPGGEDLAPSVRRLAAENALDPAGVEGTGRGGRLTKGDVLQAVSRAAAAGRPISDEMPTWIPEAAPPLPEPVIRSAPLPEPVRAPAPPAQAPAAAQAPAPLPPVDGPRQTRTKMSRLRWRIAERMVEAQAKAAILTTFNEVDMSRVMAMRKEHKGPFEKKHGQRLGFMSFFVKAVVDALETVPGLNAQIDGDEIIQNHFYDIGVAVGTDAGLVVPVVRDCDRRGFADIEREIGRLASLARDRKLSLGDLQGGSFTISNGGVYGSLLSTPILNPPQSGILGLHGIKKRPVVVDDEIVIRPMMYLAMSYDHRIVDGEQAVTFLRRIVDCIEAPERMMLDV